MFEKLFGKKKSAFGAKLVDALIAEMNEERKPLAREITDLEARLPALKEASEQSATALEQHMQAPHAAWGGSLMGETTRTIEYKRLWQERQDRTDDLQQTESALTTKRQRLRAIDGYLGADAVLADCEARHGAAVKAARVAERSVQSADDTIAGIRAEKEQRQTRRDAVVTEYKAALRVHTEAAMAARDAGKPAPEVPIPGAVDAKDATDRDLDLQLQAALQMREEYLAELAKHADGINELTAELRRARFAVARMRIEAVINALTPELAEFEAARLAYDSPERRVELPTFRSDVLADRVAELRGEIPQWKPAASAVAIIEEAPVAVEQAA